MKMRNNHFILLIYVLIFISCEKNLDFPIDKNYPTTILKLSDSEYSKLLSDFSTKNKYVYSSLDSFGFCTIANRVVPEPPTKTIDQEKVQEIINEFIAKNNKETGIAIGQTTIANEIKENSNYKGEQLFSSVIGNPIIEKIEILFSPIIFHLKNGEIVSCHGHHYKDVYIPSSFNVDSVKVKSLLESYELTHFDIAGRPQPFKIKTDDLKNTKTDLKIYPKKDYKKIELRLVWEVYIPSVNFIVYVDVMTGEKLLATPTIIS